MKVTKDTAIYICDSTVLKAKNFAIIIIIYTQIS